MTKTTRLNDLQLILLSHAARDDNATVHPLPDAASKDDARTTKELKSLLRRNLLAEMEAEPDGEALNLMSEQVAAGLLADAAPSEIWPELVRGLMGPAPAKMLGILRECGALQQILPEVAALFGVPQICDEATGVDIGEHVLNALAEAALRDAPLAARFALLVQGKGWIGARCLDISKVATVLDAPPRVDSCQ